VLLDFLRPILAAAILQVFEGAETPWGNSKAFAAYMAAVLCIAAFSFVLARGDLGHRSRWRFEALFLVALAVAVSFNQFWGLATRLDMILGLPSRPWGLPSIMGFVCFVPLWAASFSAVAFRSGSRGDPAMGNAIRTYSLPVVIVLGAGVFTEALTHLPLPLLIVAASIPGASLLALALGTAAMIFLLPLLMVHVWRTGPVEDEVLLTALRDIAGKAGVKVRRILVWFTGFSFHNALVTGIAMPFRYVLISDAILRDVQLPAIRAVFAHEVSHVRFRHFLILILSALGLLSACTLVYEVTASWGDVEAMVCAVGAGLIHIILLLGPTYRSLERQADLEGARLIGDPALMAAALDYLGNFVPPSKRRKSFTHFGVDSRVALLQKCAETERGLERAVIGQRRFVSLLVLPTIVLAVAGAWSASSDYRSAQCAGWQTVALVGLEKGDEPRTAYCLEQALALVDDNDLRLLLALHYVAMNMLDRAEAELRRCVPDDSGMYGKLVNEIFKRRVLLMQVDQHL